MTDLKKVPEIENKKNSKNKNLFKRFKINLEDFEMEKSDFDEEILDNKLPGYRTAGRILWP